MRPFFIGIAGGTASGKSELAKTIRSRATPDEVSILPLDAYYRPQDHLTLEQRSKLNFDHPDSLDFELIHSELVKLGFGQEVHLPQYDFSLHSRVGIRELIKPTPIIIVEGILIFSDERLIQSCNLRVFVDCPTEVRLTRRIARDVKERGRSAESVLVQWQSTVHPMHEQYCAPAKDVAEIIIDGQSETSAAADRILAVARNNSRNNK